MANVINMKALKTFYGTDGYIAAGQDFFTTSEALANQYYADKVAVFADGSQPQTSDKDLKVQARERTENAGTDEDQTKFTTSQLERNVTSLANPVNLKIAVEGINPEDLNIQVVRDEEVKVETKTIEQPKQQQAAYPAEKQQLQPNYQTQEQQNQAAQRQNVQPSQNQAQNSQSQPQPSSNQPVQPNQAQVSQREQELERREAELIRQLNELQKQQAEIKGQASETPSEQPSPSGEFEIRHVGGGWYDLANGERIQGKENAEARLNEIKSAYAQQQQGQVEQPQNGFTPNPEYVQQANSGAVRPEDGTSLNQAQLNTYGALSGGQPQGGLSAQPVNNSMNGVGYDSGSTVNARNEQGQFTDGRGSAANTQPRNSEGEFVGNSTGATGAQGNTTGGAAQSNNTRGGSTSGNTSGSTGNTGGSTGSGNTGQGSGGNTGQ